MRKMIASLIIGAALVLTVMVLVGTTMAAAPDTASARAGGPPVLDETFHKRPLPIGGPGRPWRGKHIKFRGTIDELPTDTLTGIWTIVDEADETRTVSVTEQTKIVPPTIEPQVGDWVQVLAREGDDEVFVAKQIVVKAKGPGPARPVEFHGEIEALPVPTDTATDTQSYLGEWVISGFTVTVDSRTMIHPEKRTPEVGMRANVIAFEQDDGTLWAKHIALHRLDSEAEVEFEGPIESLPAEGNVGIWVVGGISVTVSETTTVRGAPPAVGRIAEVKGNRLGANAVAATEIKVKGFDYEDIEFEGTVVSTSTLPGPWVFDTDTGEISATVNVSTTICNGPVEIGDWVEVKALEQDDGSLLAIRIKVEDDADEDNEVEFEGTVVSTSTLPGTWVFDTETGLISATVDADTAIVPGNTSIEIGDQVEVKALEQPDGSLLARRIKVEDSDDDDDVEVEFEGTVVSTSTLPGTWVFDTDSGLISATVDADTAIVPGNASIEIGDQVEVKALEQDGGSLLAIRIKVEDGGDGPPEQEEAEFEGVIKELPPSAPNSFNGPWIVKADGESVTVRVTGKTEIDGDPAVGLSVAVEGIWQNDGSVRAESIEVLE